MACLGLPIPERDVSYCKNEYYRVVAKDPVSQNREIWKSYINVDHDSTVYTVYCHSSVQPLVLQ